MPTIPEHIKNLAKKAKKYWWLGMALGLVCNLLPPDYKDACKAVVSACTP